MSGSKRESGYRMTGRTQWLTCPCGKRAYPTKAEAARVRRGHRGRKNLGIYRCHENPAAFHLGHKPAALMRGEITRDETVQRPRPGSPDYELADRYSREDHQ